MSPNTFCVFPVDAVELPSEDRCRIISWKEGRREGGESTSPWFIASAEQRRGEGSKKRKREAFRSGEWDQRYLKARVFEGLERKKGTDIYKPLREFFIASFRPYFSPPSISPAKGPWELPRMPLSLSALLPMRLYWWCTSERKRKPEIEGGKAMSEW